MATPQQISPAESTAQALAGITDTGLFEGLATAVLREANSTYHAVVHTGVNLAGKTVKAPVDGICFEADASPPHLIAFHHTTAALDDLAGKWLHDPATVKARGGKPTQPAGDVIKTAALVAEARAEDPDLRATLVLTTNQEPGQQLVRDVESAAGAAKLGLDLWSRSRLAHELDNTPTGQWIRNSFLGVQQEMLSWELLQRLSASSLDANRPQGDAHAWIDRELDRSLEGCRNRVLTFLVAGSGLGKSVATYRWLQRHVAQGGCGLVLDADACAAAPTIDQCVQATLRSLHPSLSDYGPTGLSLCTDTRPLALIIEDVNRCQQAGRVVDRIVSWASAESTGAVPDRFRILCPLWPGLLNTLGPASRKAVDPLVLAADSFSAAEGTAAVLARSRGAGFALDSLAAAEVAQALGHDPLLIALHDLREAADPDSTIRQFVEARVSAAAGDNLGFTATDYFDALRAMSGAMLLNRRLRPKWREIDQWLGGDAEKKRLLGRLASQAEILHLSGKPHDQQVAFRHDRVRNWLLADAAAELDRRDSLPDDVLSDPYYAEVFGAAFVWARPKGTFLDRLANLNPLAMFHALRQAGREPGRDPDRLVSAIHAWLDDARSKGRGEAHLRWEALAALSTTDAPEVPAIVDKFADRGPAAALALFRNGDLRGGLWLCHYAEPGVTAPWRDAQIEQAHLRYGNRLLEALGRILRTKDLPGPSRSSALRLAGFLRDSRLAAAIEECWTADDDRVRLLADYLWAAAECCTNDAQRCLAPICDGWAALPDTAEKEGFPSPREQLASNEVRWAFAQRPPVAALAYFVRRAVDEALRWPLLFMLNGIDHPTAVLFVVHELARRLREGKGSFFGITAADEWRRAQESGRPMSEATRDDLLTLWRDVGADEFLAGLAFAFWTATRRADDIDVLRAVDPDSRLGDRALEQRLIRGDHTAIPGMIVMLSGPRGARWWQNGRYLWSPELTEALDKELERRAERAKQEWGWADEADWITYEMIMRRPVAEAESILLKHWQHLRFNSHFVLAALYAATPRLCEAAAEALTGCPEPASLLTHLHMRYGIRTNGRPGLTREEQVRALEPYLDLLDPSDVAAIWDECTRNGWVALRSALLDVRLQDPWKDRFLTRETLVARLRALVDDGHAHVVAYRIREALDIGLAWDDALDELRLWAASSDSPAVLDVVARAVADLGSRRDLDKLQALRRGGDTDLVVADATFAVRRRSLV